MSGENIFMLPIYAQKWAAMKTTPGENHLARHKFLLQKILLQHRFNSAKLSTEELINNFLAPQQVQKPQRFT